VVAAAAAATFLAAFAAFAAVDALRRLFVLGGVAGASPMSNEQLRPMIIEINRSTLLVRRGNDSQAVHIVFDRLSFLH
jgi:hypothetical protein